MDRRLLLVTGSRSLMADLGGTHGSQLWAGNILIDRIEKAAERPTLVISGGARGPDQMSSHLADGIGIGFREYRLCGFVYGRDTKGSMLRLSRWRDADGPVVSPLERNRALVAAAVKARESGWNVRVLGLIAPWAKTHGTSHTLAQAQHSGIEVTRIECPAEYGASHG